MKTPGLAIAVLAALASCGAASADPVIGVPVTIAADQTEVTLRFVGSDAAWTGELYWIDQGNASSLIGPIFNNHASAPGDAFTLPGLFNAGDELLFAYEVITGEENMFRMDDAGAINQFAVEALGGGIHRMFIEDIKLPGGDHDYNDAIFDIETRLVPTPGSVALLGMAGAFAGFRRRHKA